MKRIFHALLLATLTTSPTILMTPALAQDDIRQERVQFKPGTSSTVVEDSITGYEIIDYVLNAREGQYMNVSMATDNSTNYFNILAPGENEVAMFNSSMGVNQYEGILPKSGDYKIRVYMMRSAARRNEVANYRLETIVTDAEDRSSTPPVVDSTGSFSERDSYDEINLDRLRTDVPIKGNSPEELALTAFGTQEVEGLVKEEVEVDTSNPQQATVIITQTNLPDDSVNSIRYKIDFKPVKNEASQWKMEWAGQQFICQPGRGNQDWSKELCSVSRFV